MNTEDFKNNEAHRRSDKGERDEVRELRDLVRDGRWEDLKDNDEYQRMRDKDKIIKARAAVDARIHIIDSMFGDVVKDDREGAVIIRDFELKPLRNLKRALNARYVGGLVEEKETETMVKKLEIKAENPLQRVA